MKQAKKYLNVHPWKIIEKNFHREQNEISESIFSLGNEYMGVRGYFEEGYTGKTIRGAFFNGIYENRKIGHPHWFKGIVTEEHFMVNAADWLYTSIIANDEKLDLAHSRIQNFTRTLHLSSGILERKFIWVLKDGSEIEIGFERFISMSKYYIAGQKITLKSISFTGNIEVASGVDFTTIHQAYGKSFWQVRESGSFKNAVYILGETKETGQRLCSAFNLYSPETFNKKETKDSGKIVLECSGNIAPGETVKFLKNISNYTEKDHAAKDQEIIFGACSELYGEPSLFYEKNKKSNTEFWKSVWDANDVSIEGDPENQQGIRFCIFHLVQTYHGISPEYGVSAKGLTGEIYSGWTWWDTETYCLPFYMFNLPQAAKNLLLYRHRTLPQAIERAKQLDCEGARYPMATINGSEAVGTWQHGDLEIHVSVAVAFGIWHYVRITNDNDFLYNEGIEMLLQICRYYSSRGQWGQKTGDFGFWGVMGPDEFAMMVHNNYYTNAMVKKAFEYTLKVVEKMQASQPDKLAQIEEKISIHVGEYKDWLKKAKKMRILQDSKTGIYEQYDGYFNMPHVDPGKIPDEQFPLYNNWAYVRIFRNDMLKQPDVLLMHLFYSNDYSTENKLANFNYYEPRCSHESSLSPSIHSILASELNMHGKAYEYARYASRLDLDNYNNNTHEGIHNTSMAAAWMNIVYGFAGLRTDTEILRFNPSIPDKWEKFSFKLNYRSCIINVTISKEYISLSANKEVPLRIMVYNSFFELSKAEQRIKLKNIAE